MTTPLLETRGLCKNFGALAAARDIDFRLERGARHALIGPNGAGKTTFVNLLTGVLPPSRRQRAAQRPRHHRACRRPSASSSASPAPSRSTGCSAACRCWRTSISRSPSGCGVAPLDAPAGRPAPGRDRRVDALARSAEAADDARTASPSCPMAANAWSSLRSRSALKPEVLLLDEPAAGVPSTESHIILDAIAALPARHRRAHHRARHGPCVPLRRAHHRAGRRRHPRRRHAAGDRSRPARARRLSRPAAPASCARAAERLRARARGGLAPATARPSCSKTSALALTTARRVCVIGRNGVGKTTLLATIMGHTSLHGGRFPAGRQEHRAPRHLSRAPAAGLGYVPQEREIFPSLTVRENLEVAARPGAGRIAAVFEMFPQARRRRRTMRQPALRRRAADAGDRARAAQQSDRAADGRAAPRGWRR